VIYNFFFFFSFLYGLKQSGSQRYIKIYNFLVNQGFKQLKFKKCIFKKLGKKNGLVCIIGLYVDDIIITGHKNQIINIVN